MKPFLKLLVVLATLGCLNACNNGAYDANPKTNNSDAPNWLNTDNAAQMGEIKFTVNGERVSHFGYYNVDATNFFSMGGSREREKTRYSVSIGVTGYKGLGTYNFGTANINTLRYEIKNPGSITSDTVYECDFGLPGSGNVQTIALSNDLLYGYFKATATLTFPVRDDTKKVDLENGSFKLAKY